MRSRVAKEFDKIDLLCARKMQDGCTKHGCLNLEMDPRNFRIEASEELLDTINYLRLGIARGEMPEQEGRSMIRSLKRMITYLLNEDIH